MNDTKNYNKKGLILYIINILSYAPIIASILAPMLVAFGVLIYFSYIFFLYPKIDIVNYYILTSDEFSYIIAPLLVFEFIIFFLGFMLFLSALLTMIKTKKSTNFDGIIENGLYEYIRHPQNLGIILMGLPFALYTPFSNDFGIRSGDLYSWSLFFLFVGIKSLFEETKMLRHFPNKYKRYMSHTGFFLPIKKEIIKSKSLSKKNLKNYYLKRILILFGFYLGLFGLISLLFFGFLRRIIVKIRFPPPTIGDFLFVGNLSFVQFLPIFIVSSLFLLIILKMIAKNKEINIKLCFYKMNP
ncbi:MAG: hypothetical protein GF329_05355 [Candidatus Lokiarchaeota archaeon]|nr:hypothetical protein [Candidatus Lokiarchaeota archaeon]